MSCLGHYPRLLTSFSHPISDPNYGRSKICMLPCHSPSLTSHCHSADPAPVTITILPSHHSPVPSVERSREKGGRRGRSLPGPYGLVKLFSGQRTDDKISRRAYSDTRARASVRVVGRLSAQGSGQTNPGGPHLCSSSTHCLKCPDGAKPSHMPPPLLEHLLLWPQGNSYSSSKPELEVFLDSLPCLPLAQVVITSSLGHPQLLASVCDRPYF